MTVPDGPLLSIVAPMFNEAEGIPLFVSQLAEALTALEGVRIPRERVEVIAVDDGSRDATPALLRELEAAGQLRVVTHATNRGLGAALWSGFGAARADLIATVDADCTYRLSDVAALVVLLDEQTSIVTASPYHPNGRVVGVPAFRLFLSRSLSRLYNAVLGTGLHTYTAMFRVYRRSALAHVPFHVDGFLAVTHLLVFPLLDGLSVREYPTTLGVRRFGTSKLRIARVIRQHLRLLLMLALRRAAVGRVR
jgi:dolichol-phosphate mannosyltransferase